MPIYRRKCFNPSLLSIQVRIPGAEGGDSGRGRSKPDGGVLALDCPGRHPVGDGDRPVLLGGENNYDQPFVCRVPASLSVPLNDGVRR